MSSELEKCSFTKQGIHQAMHHGNTAQVLDYYRTNARTYDEFSDTQGRDAGVVGMANIIAKLMPNKDAKILDVAAGTGQLGAKLKDLGYLHIDALDAVQEMLDEAKSKAIYKKYICESIEPGKALQIDDNIYEVTCALGAFGVKHLTPESLPDLIKITKPGGLIVFNIGVKYWEANDPAFHKDAVEAKLQSLVDDNLCTKRTENEITFYSRDGQKTQVHVLTKAL